MLQGKHITFSYPEPAKGKTDVLHVFRLKSESTIL